MIKHIRTQGKKICTACYMVVAFWDHPLRQINMAYIVGGLKMGGGGDIYMDIFTICLQELYHWSAVLKHMYVLPVVN